MCPTRTAGTELHSAPAGADGEPDCRLASGSSTLTPLRQSTTLPRRPAQLVSCSSFAAHRPGLNRAAFMTALSGKERFVLRAEFS